MKLLIAAIISLLISALDSFAASHQGTPAKPVRTNINAITREFDEHIKDKKGLDTNIEELKTIGVKSAENPNMDNFLDKDSKAKFELEKDRLSKIGEHELEAEGRKERSKEENNYLELFETDYSKPGAHLHKKEAEELVSATDSKLKELTKTLRDIGIDCKEARKVSEIKDPYTIEIERKEVKEVDYDQKFCEQVQKTYNCSSSLKLSCKHKFGIPLEEVNFTTVLPKSYDPGSGVLTFGWPYNFTHSGGPGTQYDYSIKFHLESLESVDEFTLLEVGYDDFIRVTVNRTQVFAGPLGGDRLELDKEKSIYVSAVPFYPFYGVKIDSSDTYHCADQFSWRLAPLNKNIRPLLKVGENTLDARLIVGGGGGVWLKFKAKVHGCTDWVEKWEEQCTLKK